MNIKYLGTNIGHSYVVGGGDKTPMAILLEWYSLGLIDIFLIYNDQMIALMQFFCMIFGSFDALKSWKMLIFLTFW